MIVEILNKVKRLYTDFSTNSRIAKLDALGLPSGKIVPNGTDDWTSARAGYLTTINSRMPSTTIASSSEVAKVGDGWNQALALKLAGLRKIPQIKVQANGLADTVYSASGTSYHNFYLSGNRAIVDYTCGYRLAQLSPAVDAVYSDIMPGGILNGSGWLYGVAGMVTVNASISLGINLIVDGVPVRETTYASHSAYQMRIVLGYQDGSNPMLSPIPMRFDSSLQVQVKGSTHQSVSGLVIYTLD